MRVLDATIFALTNLSSRRLRTGLSTLGMMFGVAAVISMLAIGAGAERQAMSLIERLGVRNVLIRAKEVPLSELPAVRKKSLGLSDRDVAAILEAIPNVALVAPKATLDAYKIIGDGHKTQAKVFGVSHRHTQVTRVTVVEGRFFGAAEEHRHAQVCVIGARVRRDLFMEGAAVGRFVKVNDVWLKVIGVMAKGVDGGEGAARGEQDGALYLPLSTLLRKFEPDPLNPLKSQLAEIVVKLAERASAYESAAMIAGLLKPLHGGEEDYEIVVPEALLAQSRQTKRLFSIVMGCIASISLLVGGIGIMNIMLASVFEQTREIGVRRAVGALRRDILVQFLVESFLVAGFGAALGVLVGFLISHGVAYYAKWPTLITPMAVLLSTGVSSAVGLFSGLYPAVRASQLDPIEALQHH